MIYELKDTATGNKAVYKTTVEIREEGNNVIFDIVGENSKFYCPYKEYNKVHSRGDAFEIIFGTDPERKVYYETEVSPLNYQFLAQMSYIGLNEKGEPKLKIDYVNQKDLFVKTTTEIFDNGYKSTIIIDKSKLDLSLGDIYFNVYRLETDGGEMEKHLFALSPTMQRKFHVPSKYVYLKDYIK